MSLDSQEDENDKNDNIKRAFNLVSTASAGGDDCFVKSVQSVVNKREDKRIPEFLLQMRESYTAQPGGNEEAGSEAVTGGGNMGEDTAAELLGTPLEAPLEAPLGTPLEAPLEAPEEKSPFEGAAKADSKAKSKLYPDITMLVGMPNFGKKAERDIFQRQFDAVDASSSEPDTNIGEEYRAFQEMMKEVSSLYTGEAAVEAEPPEEPSMAGEPPLESDVPEETGSTETDTDKEETKEEPDSERQAELAEDAIEEKSSERTEETEEVSEKDEADLEEGYHEEYREPIRQRGQNKKAKGKEDKKRRHKKGDGGRPSDGSNHQKTAEPSKNSKQSRPSKEPRPTGTAKGAKAAPNAAKPSMNKKAMGRKLLLVLALVLLLVALYFIIGKVVEATTLSSAKSAADNGEYVKAARIYNSLKDEEEGKKLLHDLIGERPELAVFEKGSGEIVQLGSMEQDGSYDNGREPIEWIILEKKDDRALMISLYCLDSKPFAESESKDFSWKNSAVRKWLNLNFFMDIFSLDERDFIADTYRSEGEDVIAGEPREDSDKIFLLDAEQARKYFDSDEKRQCAFTQYAKKNANVGGDVAMSLWWLCARNSGEPEGISMVDAAGIVNENVEISPGHMGGIRPVVLLSLKP